MSLVKSKIFLSIFLLVALVIRLAIAPVWHHEDADSFYYWGKYLWEQKDFFNFIGKSPPNAVTANYPPIFYYFLYLVRGFYVLIGKLLWFVNLKIAIFPSGFIHWYERYRTGIAFNKIPAILSDFGCAFFIYKIGRLLNGEKKSVFLMSFLFLILPASWYTSAYWGQFESLYALFILSGFYFLLRNQALLAIMAVFFSTMTKPPGLFVLPVFIAYLIKKGKISDCLVGGLFSLFGAWVLYFPFWPIKTLTAALRFYLENSRGVLNCLTANAFNFWALLFGFEPTSPETIFAGISLAWWGNLIFMLTILLILFYLWKKSNGETLILAAFLSGFSAFLFLPRMHERYFYTALVFMAILGGLKKQWRNFYLLLSFIYLINLYHFWWYPKIPFLVLLFSNTMVVSGLTIISFSVFGLFFRELKNEAFDCHR